MIVLTKTEEKIYYTIKDYKENHNDKLPSITDISELTGKSIATLRKHISAMKTKGCIRLVTKDYKLIDILEDELSTAYTKQMTNISYIALQGFNVLDEYFEMANVRFFDKDEFVKWLTKPANIISRKINTLEEAEKVASKANKYEMLYLEKFDKNYKDITE